MTDPAWGSAPEGWIGVEEELFVVDPDTLAPGTGAAEIVAGRQPRLKTELFECLVETTTEPTAGPHEALGRLRALRAEAAARAGERGLVLAASGSHPFARPEEQPIVPEERYLRMVEELGDVARGQLVCGLHVHVSMRSAEACLRALEAVLPWLPALLALSANSPYLAGERTGTLSARAARLLELPHAGAPPPFGSWAGWERAVAETGRDYTQLWWDARPHPRLGTLEVRMPDQPTDVRRSAALAALVQALAAGGDGAEPLDRARYAELRRRAARGEADRDALAAHVEPAARARGTWALVDELLASRPEAERQLAVGEAGGLEAVCRDIAERTLGSS